MYLQHLREGSGGFTSFAKAVMSAVLHSHCAVQRQEGEALALVTLHSTLNYFFTTLYQKYCDSAQ